MAMLVITRWYVFLDLDPSTTEKFFWTSEDLEPILDVKLAFHFQKHPCLSLKASPKHPKTIGLLYIIPYAPWCWYIKTYKTGWFCSGKCWFAYSSTMEHLGVCIGFPFEHRTSRFWDFWVESNTTGFADRVHKDVIRSGISPWGETNGENQGKWVFISPKKGE